MTVAAALNSLGGPPSRVQANRRLDEGVRLSAPVNANTAIGWLVVADGPLMISVVGGVLSTITAWFDVAVFAGTIDRHDAQRLRSVGDGRRRPRRQSRSR